jgi:outer membrane immunogenic protein
MFGGYDYQIGRAVVGLEADYNRSFGSNYSHIHENEYPGEGGTWSVRSDWTASIRGRLGYLVTDRALIYGTGGVAFTTVKVLAGVESDPSVNQDPHWGNIGIGGGTRVGWTAGAGIQYALDPNWSLRGEYRHSDYGKKTLNYTTLMDGGGTGYVDTNVTANLMSVGLSYKFGEHGNTAADFPVKAPVLRSPVASWTGFYVGGQIGINNASTEASGFDTGGYDNHGLGAFPNGAAWGPLTFPMAQTSAGVFGGYDYQVSRFVLGLEADYNRLFGSHHSHVMENEYPGTGGIWRIGSDWNASIRGRLGYLVTDRALVYGTGGVAFTSVNVRAGVESDPCLSCFGLADQTPAWGDVGIGGGTRVGWTAGGGIQYALDSNWSLRGEYRYSDYGTKTLSYSHGDKADFNIAPGTGHVDTKVTANLMSVGLSYKFGGYGNSATDLPVKAALLRAAPISSWTGLYIGGQIGATNVSTEASGFDTGGYDNHRLFDFPNGAAWGPLTFPMTQMSAGVFGGYDYQIGRFVLGVEGDYNRLAGSTHSHMQENEYPGTSGIWSVGSDWNASIRGRLGYLVTDRALVYATGGVAFTEVNVRAGVENNPNSTFDETPAWGDIDIGGGTRVGWTAGGGIQYALDSNWSLRGEYRHNDYGTKTLTYAHGVKAGSNIQPGTGNVDMKVTSNLVSVGLSYKFGGLGDPVVARY